MKEIEINSKVHGKQVVLVDDEDYEELSKYTWVVSKGQKTLYANRSFMINYVTTIIPMHRAIMGLEKGDRRTVDHIDGNGLNNQKYNLRICTKKENSRNIVKNESDSKKTSKYKGVFKRNNLYFAVIMVDYKYISLGSFRKEEDAALAYDLAALKYFGEFASTNFKIDLENYDNLLTQVESSKYIHPPKTSKYVGVHYHKSKDRWVSSYKNKQIGYFKSEDDAYNAQQRYIESLRDN
jgi:hypothetical protein